MKRILTVVLLGCLWLGGCSSPPALPPQIGNPAPAFQLARADGAGTLASEALSGDVVVLNFWSTSCLVCLAEIEDLKKVHAQGHAKVVGIALDDDREKVQKLVQSKGISYPVLMGDEATFERFDGYNIPYTLVLDRAGVIRKKVSGRFGEGEMEALLQSLAGDGEVALATE